MSPFNLDMSKSHFGGNFLQFQLSNDTRLTDQMRFFLFIVLFMLQRLQKNEFFFTKYLCESRQRFHVYFVQKTFESRATIKKTSVT